MSVLGRVSEKVRVALDQVSKNLLGLERLLNRCPWPTAASCLVLLKLIR